MALPAGGPGVRRVPEPRVPAGPGAGRGDEVGRGGDGGQGERGGAAAVCEQGGDRAAAGRGVRAGLCAVHGGRQHGRGDVPSAGEAGVVLQRERGGVDERDAGWILPVGAF